MREENFSMKDSLKIVSKTKMKSCWSTIDQNYTVHKLHSKFRTHKNCESENNLYLYIFLKKTC